MKIAENITELIGNTPIVRINKLNDGGANVFAKLEMFNPLGSVKDRAAFFMIEQAEKDGLLKAGSVIVEPTSGNTGVGLAYIAAVRGYKVVLTMPETMSMERRKLLAALGAEIVLTEGIKGMKGAIEMAAKICRETEGAFMPQQFENLANANAHRTTTGPEIWKDMDGKVDIFVAGVGSGGTITGVGEYLKTMNKCIKIVAIEPSSSPVISGGVAGPHKIQGIGAGFVPKLLDISVIDEILKAGDAQAGDFARRAAQQEGLLVGISSGAALWGAVELSNRPENKGKNIIALLPDTGERYLSTWLYEKPEK